MCISLNLRSATFVMLCMSGSSLCLSDSNNNNNNSKTKFIKHHNADSRLQRDSMVLCALVSTAASAIAVNSSQSCTALSSYCAILLHLVASLFSVFLAYLDVQLLQYICAITDKYRWIGALYVC